MGGTPRIVQDAEHQPMKLARRKLLRFAAAAVALPAVHRFASAQAARPLAERLADYADRLRYDDLDPATIERVKAHVIDTLGCGIAAIDERPVRICRDVALARGEDGTATVIGTNRRTTPDLAAFANGAAFRYYDLNDTYSPGHPSDNIAPCLAVAESERSSAAELITAIVLAYEVGCRLTDVVEVMARGWDAPLLSLPAVALAAGKLMKLPADKLAQAVNLAINDHVPMGQTRAQTLSDWKGLADAEAGRNAVFAATLARAGLSGPAPIFEGRKGLFQLVSGPAEVDVGAFGGRGVPFKIHQCGVKAYPAVVYAQTAIVAALAVAKEVGNIDRVAAIEIATTPRGHQQAGSEPEKWAPDTKETADHSLPYITARAMFDGDIDNDSYAAEKLRDPRILAFMRKITVQPDPALTTRSRNAPPTRLTATLEDGKRITRQVDNIPGFPGQPMSRADVERKFRSNVGKRWQPKRTDDILQALWALEHTDDLRRLLGTLSLQS
jgi:2-methylcitrate dehydratase